VETTRLRVTLLGVEPTVIRVIDVPAVSTLPELHEQLQAAVGWTDSHLHQFVTDEALYGVPDLDAMEDERDETGVLLRDLPARFSYLYDFGDGWDHTIEVIGRGDDQPGCRYGEGMCPPEDVGGVSGYAELLAVLADPAHEDHRQLREWAGELVDFDLTATDLLVRQTVGEVPASVRLILDLAKDGVKLTPGGRLPRVFVRQVQEHRPQWHLFGRQAAREDDLLPLAALHRILRSVGLLRLSKGILRPTRAAADDLQVVRRLRAWFLPDDSFEAILAGVTVAVLASKGPLPSAELATEVFPMLGHRWMSDGHPLTDMDVRMSIARDTSVLTGLDLIETSWPVYRAGASARTLLPRATALAHLWSVSPK
jgi:hypothetical protein